MLDLTKPWPFDLAWKGWAAFALGFVLVLTVVYRVDVPISL